MKLPEKLAIDRDVKRVFQAWTRWIEDPETRDDPFVSLRYVAGQTTYDALRAGPFSLAELPHIDALRQWVGSLTQARIVSGLDLDLAKATRDQSDPDGTEAPWPSWLDSWRGVAHASSAAEVREHIEHAIPRGTTIASILRERSRLRREVARRLGLEPVFTRESTERLAEQFLERTRDVAREVLRGPVLLQAAARDAPDGWPARLTARWPLELFEAGVEGLRVPLSDPYATFRRPSATSGAASFARALGAFGFALRTVTGAPSLPFALTRSPGFVEAHRWGTLFASLAMSDEFHRRALRVGKSTASSQARAVARSALFELRLSSVRLLLMEAPERFEELSQLLFGIPLDKRLAGAWPAARDDETERFVGMATSCRLESELVERFDTDWFCNPRGWLFLRSLGSGAVHDDPEALSEEQEEQEPLLTAWTRRFERAFA